MGLLRPNHHRCGSLLRARGAFITLLDLACRAAKGSAEVRRNPLGFPFLARSDRHRSAAFRTLEEENAKDKP